MTGLLLSARERKSRAARKAPARCLYKGSAAWSLLRHEASRDTATLELQNLHHRQHPALESLEKQRGRMENSSSSHPPPPPGYPTAAGAEQQQQQGGRKQGRRGKTTSRGEKGFIEGCIAALCCCWICEMCCD